MWDVKALGFRAFGLRDGLRGTSGFKARCIRCKHRRLDSFKHGRPNLPESNDYILSCSHFKMTSMISRPWLRIEVIQVLKLREGTSVHADLGQAHLRPRALRVLL